MQPDFCIDHGKHHHSIVPQGGNYLSIGVEPGRNFGPESHLYGHSLSNKVREGVGALMVIITLEWEWLPRDIFMVLLQVDRYHNLLSVTFLLLFFNVDRAGLGLRYVFSAI